MALRLNASEVYTMLFGTSKRSGIQSDGLAMTQVTLFDIWAQVPPDYFERGTRNNILQRAWHRKKLSVVRNAIGAQDVHTILEVGSADGTAIATITKSLNVQRILAIDPYFPPLQHGSHLYRTIQFIQADGHRLPFRSNSINVITLLETLEHVADPEKTLIEMKRVLKRNGRVIVEMDSGSLLFQLVWIVWKLIGPGKVWRGSHLTFFDVGRLERLFRKTGFIVREKRLFTLGMGVCFVLKKKT